MPAASFSKSIVTETPGAGRDSALTRFTANPSPGGSWHERRTTAANNRLPHCPVFISILLTWSRLRHTQLRLPYHQSGSAAHEPRGGERPRLSLDGPVHRRSVPH